MNWRVLHIAVLACVMLAGCEDDPCSPCGECNCRYEARDDFRFAVPADGFPLFQVTGVNGEIEVTTQAMPDSVVIWGERRVISNSSEADAEAHLSDLEVRVVKDAGGISARTIQPTSADGREYEVEYHALVPRAWETDVVNVNGNVSVSGSENAVTVVLTNGQVVLEEIEGETAVDLVNGQVNAGVTLPPDGSCRISIVNGQIELTIPDDTSADLSASVTNGTVSVTGLTITDLNTTPTSVTGMLGEGNGEIDLTAVNGTIWVGAN